MRYDLIDLKLFKNIHEAGTITAGAEASYMTLASASERIRGMEDELGTPLLVRDRRGIRLTPAGTILLHHAHLMLQQMERMYGELADYGMNVKGHVHLLCNTAAMSEYLPEVLSTFLMHNPGISVEVEERKSSLIAEALRNSRCDLGLVSASANLDKLEVVNFKTDPLVLVLPADHSLARHDTLRLQDVLEYPFVGLAEGSPLQEHLAQNARRLGRRMNFRIRLQSMEAVCGMVGRGIGLGIVPQTAAARCALSAGIRTVGLADAWATRQLVLCARSFDALPPHAHSLVQHILATGMEA